MIYIYNLFFLFLNISIGIITIFYFLKIQS